MKKISLKVFTVVLISSLFVLFFLGYICLSQTKELFTQESKTSLELLASNYAKEFSNELLVIEDKVNELELFIKNTIDFNKLQNDKEYLSEYEKTLAPIVENFANQRTSSIAGWVYFDPSYSDTPHDVYFVDGDGDKLADRQDHIPFSYYDNKPTPTDDKQWWYGPIKSKSGFWTNPYEWKLINNKIIKVTSYAKPVYIDGNFICVVGTYYRFDNIIETIESINPYDAGYATLFNEKLDVIIHPKYNSGTRFTADNLLTVNDGIYRYISNKLLNTQSGVINLDMNSANDFFAYSRLSNDWIIAIIPDYNTLFKSYNNLVHQLSIALLICVLISFISAYIIGKTITKPLLKVAEVAKQIGTGDLSVKIPVTTKDEVSIIANSLNDMTANISQLQSNLYTLAYVDEITGDRNYNKFREDAQRVLEENSDTPYILIKIDIDNFKLINKLYGFNIGDKVLQAVSKSISHVLNYDEIFARLNVDEFVILHKYSQYQDVYTRFAEFEKHFYILMGSEFNYKANFLLGTYYTMENEKNNINIKDLFEKVNFAHRKAKQSGKFNAIVNYDDFLTTEILQQKEIENVMESALIQEDYLLYLQPKYRLSDYKIGGAEALVRWRNNSTILFPNDFIPIFEKNGFITKLDMYMLNKSCQLIKSWIDDGIEPVVISVNFSRLHLKIKTFVEDLCEVVDSYNIPRKLIEVELTETTIFDNFSILEKVLLDLHNKGFTLSMDDFGSGYSSLGLLKDLPVDVIKIDRSFFVNQSDEKRTQIVLSNILNMAAQLNIHTVAEGVEHEEDINFLKKLGCDMVQGYYFAKPMTVDDFNQTMIQ